ncbi:hypothetical protein Ahy_A05g022135 isoform B [Arachis hypogaea]|uniref:TF-B3 domain-containing protein n=1 Tax=Arachis hypogaea TaxID=3818 RepID=A0A445CZU2_ARAHY|nr:hypothetical protein Ahy_A05g022135 isoform B [Arachis hypogaea]
MPPPLEGNLAALITASFVASAVGSPLSPSWSREEAVHVFLQEQGQATCNSCSRKPATQSLPITPNELPNWTPYINLVVLDGRDACFRCFWKEQQNRSITLTRGWPQFYWKYQINLDSMLFFKHNGNSEFQVRIFDFGGRENTYQP